MIHIACNIDHRYVPHCAVTLSSIFTHCAEGEVTAHIVARELTDKDRALLAEVAIPMKGRLCYYEPDAHLLDGFTIRATHGRITLPIYYRCFLSELLPVSIDRVIYLDCDLLVLRDLRPLWEVNLEGNVLAAVDDAGCAESDRYERLCYPEVHSYFNAGVLLIDLAAWRRVGMAGRLAGYYAQHERQIVFNDQDVLNGELHASWLKLPVEWNVQDAFYRRRNSLPSGWAIAHADALRSPAILHYTNRKPWNYDSQHPLRSLWFEYVDRTPWHGCRPWQSPINIVKRFFRLLPFRLGLRPRRYVKLDSGLG